MKNEQLHGTNEQNLINYGVVSPAEVALQSIVDSPKPLDEMNRLSALVDITLSHEYLRRLKIGLTSSLNSQQKQEPYAVLIWSCLPQLNKQLQRVKTFGVDQKELVEAGFNLAAETVNRWNPTLRSGQPYYLRTFAASQYSYRVESFIAQKYGIKADDFPVIPLYFQAHSQFKKINSRQPTMSDLAEIIEYADNFQFQLSEDKRAKISKTRFKTETSGKTFDLLEIVHSNYVLGRETVEFLEGNNDLEDYVDLDTLIDNEERDRILRKKLSELDRHGGHRLRQILEMRFGLTGEAPKTLEEVNKIFKLTRERVRQLELAALRKLCHPHYSRKLKPYLEASLKEK